MGDFSFMSTLPRLKPVRCRLNDASRVPYDTRTYHSQHDQTISESKGRSLTTSYFFNWAAFILPEPCQRHTAKPSACVSISCFHCMRATTGATTKDGFRRGSESNRAIVWILQDVSCQNGGDMFEQLSSLTFYPYPSHLPASHPSKFPLLASSSNTTILFGMATRSI